MVLVVNIILKKEFRNVFLFFASLLFYAWGEHLYVILMLYSITINYFIGSFIGNNVERSKKKSAKNWLLVGVLANLSILVFFKYSNFIVDNLSHLGIVIELRNIPLPLGISFFTFQCLSYLVDVYRQEVTHQKNPIQLGLYVSLFPQLIAGPIVRYSDIAKQISNRVVRLDSFSEGCVRFIRGLAKKIIIANGLGLLVDKTFDVNPNDLGSLLVWLAMLCYSLQIYYDFSGYSDMAIGLGKMFGFDIKENFDHPYSSTSIKNFWRRWHISLSTWFRDYLYIPLGGNRLGNQRTYFNLVIVFFITGLWHGASWNFIIWGLYHGLFLLLEKRFDLSILSKIRVVGILYTSFIVLIGWVFFRSDSLSYAIGLIWTMFNFTKGVAAYPFLLVDTYFWLILVLGIAFSFPLRRAIKSQLSKYISLETGMYSMFRYLAYILIFVYTLSEMAQSTYNPFIYYRF